MALQFGGAGAAGAAEEPALVGGSFGAADAFPKDFGYGEEEEEAELDGGPGSGGPGGGGGAGGPGGGAGGADSKPRILLMGLRRSGKSSIQKVSAAPRRSRRPGSGEGGLRSPGKLRSPGGGRPGRGEAALASCPQGELVPPVVAPAGQPAPGPPPS